jgi:CHAT domain-containing protein
LARRSAAFRAAQAQQHLAPAQLQAALPQGTVLLDFLEHTQWKLLKEPKTQWHKEHRLAAFVVRSEGLIVQLDLGPVEPISRAVRAWRGAYGKPDGRIAREEAAALRRLVWQPLEPHVKGATTVLVSPDGALTRLPLAALPGSQPGTYLLEEVPLAVVPVPQLLPELLARGGPAAQGKAAAPSLLLVGDVDFDAAPAAAAAGAASPAGARGSRDGVLQKFGRLPATLGEISVAERYFKRLHRDGTATTLDGAEATEAAFRQQAPKHRYLHLATHGFFAPANLRSALAPAPGPAAGAKGLAAAEADWFGRQGVSGFHPGLLSGLVLAGANRPAAPDQDDGILTALEVAELDLGGVELAVLSACETGLGEEAGGEGLLGLQRAFQVAGARTVVASLWKVSDEATRQLMERFYANLWQKKLPRLEALRQAQLWLLREGQGVRGLVLDGDKRLEANRRLPPFYWAAFVLSGDWR